MHFFKTNKYFKIFAFLLVLVHTVMLCRFVIMLGPFYTSDTISYLNMASNVLNGLFPHSDAYSPGYPFLIGITSRLIQINLENSLLIWIFLLIILSFITIQKVIKLISEYNNNYYNFILAFVVLSNWVVLKILVTAHADALFLFFTLLFLYFSALWFTTKITKWFILASLIGFISLWIKLNGLVFIPFLVFLYILQTKKKDINYKFIGLPLIGFILSFNLFKFLNGTVISHFQSLGFFDKLILAITNYDLLFNNLISSGQAISSAFFSKYITNILPKSFFILIILLFIYLFFKYVFISRKEFKTRTVFFLFSFIYWLFLFLLQQFIDFEEINTRTLFPSILGILFWLISFFNEKNNKIKYIVTILIVFNLLYSFFFVYKLSSSDPNNCFNSVVEFKNRKSVVELQNIKTLYSIQDRIYTNKNRSLIYALNFAKISRYPTVDYFRNGKIRYYNEDEFNKLYSFFCSDFLQKRSVLLLFDQKNLSEKDSCLLTDKTKILYVENDILIMNVDLQN